MTDAQFQAIATLIRSRPSKVRDAARLVLVAGYTQTRAALDCAVSGPSVSQCVSRFRAAQKLAKTI